MRQKSDAYFIIDCDIRREASRIESRMRNQSSGTPPATISIFWPVERIRNCGPLNVVPERERERVSRRNARGRRGVVLAIEGCSAQQPPISGIVFVCEGATICSVSNAFVDNVVRCLRVQAATAMTFRDALIPMSLSSRRPRACVYVTYTRWECMCMRFASDFVEPRESFLDKTLYIFLLSSSAFFMLSFLFRVSKI